MSINERIRKEAQRIRDEADVAIGRARAELQRSRNTFFDSDVTLNQIGICREEIERAEKHIKDGQYQFAAEAYASSDIRMYRLVFVHKDCPLPKDFCTSEQIFTEAARNITARTQEFIGQGRLREAGQFLGGYMRAVTKNYDDGQSGGVARNGIFKALREPLQGILDSIPAGPSELLVAFRETAVPLGYPPKHEDLTAFANALETQVGLRPETVSRVMEAVNPPPPPPIRKRDVVVAWLLKSFARARAATA